MVYDYIIVGGGIGGISAYLILSYLGKSVLLFEKLSYLGGCAGTFKHGKNLYNVGASTLVGIENNLPLGLLMDMTGKDKSKLPIKPINPAIKVYVNDKIINRYKDKDEAFEEINQSFYHKNNKKLWDTIYKISSLNWDYVYKLLPFNPSSKAFVLKTFFKNLSYFKNNGIFLVKTAKNVIKSYIPDISDDYVKFLNSQILMTSQGYWDEVSFSIASMGLTYPNLDNYYVFGGINNVLESLVKDERNILRKTEVLKIKKSNNLFKVYTTKGEFLAKRVILNKTIWDYCEVLDEDLKNSLCKKNKQKYSKIWSAATLYFTVEDKENILTGHHYQVLHEENPFTGSSSFFMSVADKDDIYMNKNGDKSITISTHCKISLWENLDEYQYKERKQALKNFIFSKIYQNLPVFKKLKVKDVLVGTPKTFHRYTGRYKGTVGGIPLLKDYTMLNYPSGITPIKDLFLVGDSIFPGQGFPGVILGVFNLMLLIERGFNEVFYRHIS